ncbi:MAG: hypothetical protein ABL998_04025 [Planctomycetota bacterium]
MKKLFNRILILAGLVGAFYFVGLIVPRQQKLGSYTTLDARPIEVYATIADLSTWDDWHADFASVRELPEEDHERRWQITDPEGNQFVLEESVAEEGARWQGTYERLGSRFTWRFDLTGYADGSRVSLSKTVETRDTWLRAKRFLWFGEGASALAVLNSLSEHLGEAPQAIKDND